MTEVVIVDYGIGNLLSVARALEMVGAMPVLSADPQVISNADRLILPGVGAFGYCMQQIIDRHLEEPILRFAEKQRPLLGICVGMQVLHSLGEEYGEHRGLGLIKGMVKKIPAIGASNQQHKLPFIGWSKLNLNKSALSSRFNQVLSEKHFYFVHSYMAVPESPDHVLAYYTYNGVDIVAATQKDHFIGLQCHPEKSANSGLDFLRIFVRNI